MRVGDCRRKLIAVDGFAIVWPPSFRFRKRKNSGPGSQPSNREFIIILASSSSSMGCVQSQSNGQAAKDKGGGAAGVINDNNGQQGGASAVILDPRLPLNARQKYSMLASWKGISRALEPTGVYMFIKY